MFFILALVALGLELWAVADCARHRANAFEATGKRTKTFWLALTGGAALIGVISFFSSGGGFFGTLGLFGRRVRLPCGRAAGREGCRPGRQPQHRPVRPVVNQQPA